MMKTKKRAEPERSKGNNLFYAAYGIQHIAEVCELLVQFCFRVLVKVHSTPKKYSKLVRVLFRPSKNRKKKKVIAITSLLLAREASGMRSFTSFRP
jgi:hypothetical protein